MKTVSYFFSVLFFSLLIVSGCKKDPLIPLVTTTEVSDITLTSAKTGGNVTEDGGEAVTERGICWSTTLNPSKSDNTSIDGSGTGAFTHTIEGLIPGTTYYVRAYATNSVGTAYGEQVTFSTTPVTVPVLATSTITDITLATAKSGGNISSDGGGAVTARGICWGTAENPTTSNNVTINGTGTGIFESNLQGLAPGTTFFVRSYATNSAGTAYGNQLTFTTTSIVVPTLTTTEVTGITLNGAVSGGNITNNGGNEVTARGIVWSTTVNPTTANSSISSGTGSGIFVSNLSGLTPATTYYVRAYATNSMGTAYGNQQTFTTSAILPPTVTTAAVTNITSSAAVSGGNVTNNGGANVTARGIVWSTAHIPTLADQLTTTGSGNGTFVSNMASLTQGTIYYVRAYATNSAGTAYGSEVTFTTAALAIPTVTTASITSITTTSAVSGGNVTNSGGATVTARGIVWSTTMNPDLNDNEITTGAGTGTFTSNISGLTEGTTYYVRAYATNSVGTGYGTQLMFKTTMPTLTDIDGNVYEVVKIGDQVWMAENLKTTRFNNNTVIPNVTDGTAWGGLTTPAFSWYNNNISNKDIYGAIYNWYTVATGNLCPAGWHEPTEAEYSTLEISLGLTAAETDLFGWRGTNQGAQLKATTTWTGGNGTNSSGFAALAGGYRQWGSNAFYGVGELTYFWTATDDADNDKPTVAYYRLLDASESRVYKATTEKIGGKYVRCLKD